MMRCLLISVGAALAIAGLAASPTLAQAPGAQGTSKVGFAAGQAQNGLVSKIQYRLYYVLQTRVHLRYPPYQCYCYSVSTSQIYPNSWPVASYYSYSAAVSKRGALASTRGACPNNCRGGSVRQYRNRNRGGINAAGHAACRQQFGAGSYATSYAGGNRWNCHIPQRRVYRRQPTYRQPQYRDPRGSPGGCILGQC